MRDGIVLVRFTPLTPLLATLAGGRGGGSRHPVCRYILNDQQEHEYEAQDEGDPDDVRDRIVLVRLTPLPLLILTSLAGERGGD